MEESEIDLRSVFGLLRRQFRLIILTVVAIVSLAAVWVFAQTPIYTASTVLMFDPSKKNLLEPDAIATSASADNARIDSEVEIMRSDNILLNVIRDRNLVSDPEFGVSLSMRQRVMSLLRLGDAELPTGEQALNQALSKLRSSVSVQRRGLTYLLSIQVRSETPAKAAELANAIAQAYINDQLASKINNTLASRDILQASITAAREAIVASESSFDSFISSNINRIVEDTGRIDIASMQAQLAELTQARQAAATTADAVQGQLSQGNFASVVQALQIDALTDLERQRTELNEQIANAGENSPVSVDLRASLAAIETRLQETAQDEVARLRNQVSDNQAQESSLRDSVRTAVLGSDLSADVLTGIYELQQNAALARGQYETLLSRVQSLETQASLQVSDARIVSPALPPSGASFPSVTTTIAIAALLAAGLGVALAFLYENYLGGFTTVEQLESVLKLRVATSTPKERPTADQKSVADLTVTAPLSVLSEATRRVRANIDQITRQAFTKRRGEHGGPEGGHVIMVTSSVPNEGKSTMALSLARSYALSGRSTLLIDCDLRKPSIHRQLGLEPSQGFVDFLSSGNTETVNIADVITVDPLSTVTVVLGARRSNLPTDQLIGSQAFARLLTSARQTFSVIVLDTPPVGAVVDGLYVAPFVDVIAFVVRWASTQQSEVKAGISAIRAAKSEHAEILTILSQQEQSQSAYANKYGDYYIERSS